MNDALDIPSIPQERAVTLTALFSVLMHSARVGKLRDAREVQDRLEQEGVVVHFLRRREGEHGP